MVEEEDRLEGGSGGRRGGLVLWSGVEKQQMARRRGPFIYVMTLEPARPSP